MPRTNDVRRRRVRDSRDDVPTCRWMCAGPGCRTGGGTLSALGLRRACRGSLARSRFRLLCGGVLGWSGLGGLELLTCFGDRGSRWQEAFGIEVAGLVGRLPDAEVHIGLRQLAGAACPDHAHLRTLGNGSSLDRRDRSEMEERDREAVWSSNRDRATALRHRAGKRDLAGRWSAYGLPWRTTHIDATVLPGGVLIAVVAEVLQNRPARRPGPGVRGRRAGQEREEGRQQQAVPTHAASSVVCIVNRSEDSAIRVSCQDRRHDRCRSGLIRAAVRCDSVPAFCDRPPLVASDGR